MHMLWSQVVYTHIANQLNQHGDATCVILICSKDLIGPDVLEDLQQAGWRTYRLPSEPVRFRHAYEDLYRARWPFTIQRVLFLVEKEHESGFLLPFDIEHDNPIVEVEMANFFPLLDASILRLVPPEKYEALFQYVQTFGLTQPLSRHQTLAIVLKACYGLDLPTRFTLPEYVRFLADLVRSNVRLPPSLAREVERQLSQQLSISADLSLANARNFLRAVWEIYRAMVTPLQPGSGGIGEQNYPPVLIDAASLLGHSPEIQAAFTHLCLTDLLPRWEVDEPPREKWLLPHVHYIIREGLQLAEHLEALTQQIPTETDSWDTWTLFAYTWAEYRTRYYILSSITDSLRLQFEAAHQHVETQFFQWLTAHYRQLLQMPYLPRPHVVHHLLHYVAATYGVPHTRSMAIVVIDGMALEDWLLIRSREDLSPWHYHEHVIAAFIPTVTPVSRQALLSGEMPTAWDMLLHSTHREEELWAQFWAKRGVASHQVGYWRGVGWGDVHNIRGHLETRPYRAVAIIVETLDRMLHHTEDMTGFYAQWLALLQRHTSMRTWLNMLGEFFDVVVVTSDHGHVEGVGAGDISLGKVAETRALRARIFGREMQKRTTEHPAAIRWPNVGLPSDLTVVLAKDLLLFAKEGKRAVAHGGASVEEVIVPAIIFTREERG